MSNINCMLNTQFTEMDLLKMDLLRIWTLYRRVPILAGNRARVPKTGRNENEKSEFKNEELS